jgi:hypothetical protein
VSGAINVPQPWKAHALAVGGVGAVGFAQCEDQLVVVSHNGLGIFDLGTFERIARDVGPFHFDAADSRVSGIGPSASIHANVFGLQGAYRTDRQLPTTTPDGWSVTCSAAGPGTSAGEVIVGLHAPGAGAGAPIGSFESLSAIGFSPYGTALAIAESHTITLLTRPLARPASIESWSDYWLLFEVLCQSLRAAGESRAVQALRGAQGSVNGLTDGWHDFLNALRSVEENHPLSSEQAALHRELANKVKDALDRRG